MALDYMAFHSGSVDSLNSTFETFMSDLFSGFCLTLFLLAAILIGGML